MDLGLQGRVAVVLAASKGLGRACARALAQEGCRLAICARGAAGLEETAREIRSEFGVPVLARPVDVESREAMRGFVRDVLAEYGAVHVLVTNSGGPPPGNSRSLRDEEWDGAVRSSLMVAVDWTREVAPIMVKQEWGRILHITSTSVKQPIDGLILSNTMRVGVVGFAKSISRELAPHNVLVNTICPGSFRTDRLVALARSRGAGDVEGALERMAAEVPMGRLGDPEELGSVVAFLASERAGYVTGATIQVDGGAVRGLM